MSALQTQYAKFQRFYPKPSESRYVDDLTDYFENERASGKTLYFMTATYNDSKDFPLTPEKACRNFNAFRMRLLKRLFGSGYNKSQFHEIEPTIFAFLDTSFSKRKNKKLEKVPKHESRFHHHCVLVVDDACTESLDCLLDKVSREAFMNSLTPKLQLRSLNLQKIKPTRKDTRTVVDYCSKTARKFPHDDMMLQVYPISRSEFRSAA